MLVTQSCLTLWDHMDCSLPGSSVHGFPQARVLEWVAISSSRGSSRPRDRTHVSCIAGGFFNSEPQGKHPILCGPLLDSPWALIILARLLSSGYLSYPCYAPQVLAAGSEPPTHKCLAYLVWAQVPLARQMDAFLFLLRL